MFTMEEIYFYAKARMLSRRMRMTMTRREGITTTTAAAILVII
jgi:hypothetical protein